MIFYRICIFGLLFAMLSCNKGTPNPICSDSGKFVMALNHVKGRVMFDPIRKDYRIHFSNDGSIAHNAIGVPCNLREIYRTEVNIIFSGYFYERKTEDSTDTAYAIAIREIDYY